jgi:FkbM family methyltransferase
VLDTARGALKSLRSWPPLNIPVTTACRAGLRTIGRESRLLVRYLPRTGLVEAVLPSGETLRMWSLGDDQIASRVFWRGWSGHESETSSYFYELASQARVTLDIGAHVGYFALLASYANPLGSVYAFEPLPRVHERLVRNVRLNERGNIHCVPMAVGAKPGTADLFHVKEGIPSSSTLSHAFASSIDPDERLSTTSVDVVSVDRFTEQRGLTGIDLVKIDTETTEEAVLVGMIETLRNERPIVFCEILSEPAAESIGRLFHPLRYRYLRLTDGGPEACATLAPSPDWRNFCFMPE